MADWTDARIGALRRLIKKAEQDPEFTNDDIEALRKWADTLRGVYAFGRLGKWLIFILAAVATALTAGDTIMEKVRAWLGA